MTWSSERRRRRGLHGRPARRRVAERERQQPGDVGSHRHPRRHAGARGISRRADRPAAAAIAKISSLNLGPNQGSIVAPPALLPDGKVIFFVQINGGSAQMILRADPVAQTLTTLVTLGGAGANATPAGGTYDSATSAPAVDDAGAITFSASIDAATTSEALIWDPPAGAPQAILIGDAVPEPSSGFFGGPPFFAPKLNDAGDVVFKSYVAKGPALGIFRYRQGALQALVRIQDSAPLPPLKGATLPPRFTNLVGDPSLNASGDIAFAATVEGGGRGVFATRNGALQSIAQPLGPLEPEDLARPGAFFRTIAANPALSDSGSVAFRGQLQYGNPIDPIFLPDIRENDVFLADQSGIHVIAAQGDDSGVPGQPLFAFHDPSIAGSQVTFRANLGIIDNGPNGIFLADSIGLRPVAVEQQNLGAMTVNTLSGQPDFDASGDVFFSAKVKLPDNTNQGAILRRAPGGVNGRRTRHPRPGGRDHPQPLPPEHEQQWRRRLPRQLPGAQRWGVRAPALEQHRPALLPAHRRGRRARRRRPDHELQPERLSSTRPIRWRCSPPSEEPRATVTAPSSSPRPRPSRCATSSSSAATPSAPQPSAGSPRTASG